MTLDQRAGSELDHLLCFDLYAASRAVTAAYRPILAELGLTYPQYLALTVLWEHGPAPIRHLATALRLDHATLTPLLRRLESAGLVTRRRSADDERSVVVSLTPDGDALRGHADRISCQVAEIMGLEPGEARQLQATLRRLTANAG